MSTGIVQAEPLRMDWAKKYIGSKGLAIKYLYEELNPGIDPLSEDNKLIFMTTPLTGTSIPCSGKLSIAAKSPATGTICDCSIGGHAALKIKYAGYDAMILEGKYEKPCYIFIEDTHVEIMDAGQYWGWVPMSPKPCFQSFMGMSTAISPSGRQGRQSAAWPVSTQITTGRPAEAVWVQ